MERIKNVIFAADFQCEGASFRAKCINILEWKFLKILFVILIDIYVFESDNT